MPKTAKSEDLYEQESTESAKYLGQESVEELFDLETLEEDITPFMSWNGAKSQQIEVKLPLSSNSIRRFDGPYDSANYMRVFNLSSEQMEWMKISSVRMRKALAQYTKNRKGKKIRLELIREGSGFDTTYLCKNISS